MGIAGKFDTELERGYFSKVSGLRRNPASYGWQDVGFIEKAR
jgi:hypothetical protein